MRKILAIATMMAMMLTAYPMMPANQAHAASTKAPAKVAGLRATTASTTAIKLSWKAVTKASGYTVYRNGYAVASTKSTSFVDTGLRANSVYTYKVKAYKNYKQKQYYNKKTKKWQTKKPAKKYRGKTRKVVKHKYGKASVQATARTATNPSTPSIPSTPSTPSMPSDDDEFEHVSTPPVAGGNGPFPVDDKITLTYSANNSSTKTTIYLGQTWTSTVKENLKCGSSGFVAYTRNKFYVSITNGSAYDGTAYLYDIGDYDNFLKVDVANGQIVGWQTIASSMADSHGLAIRRGKYYEWTPSNSQQMNYVYADFCESTALRSVTGLNYEIGGYIIGGIKGYTNITNNSVLNMGGLRSNEKMIGFHYVNAARVHAGRNKLTYNNYLDGGSKTVTTTSPIEERIVSLTTGTSQDVSLAPGTYRYGAQPAAETLSANSPKRSHDFDKDGLTKGPLGGWNTYIRWDVISVASNNSVTVSGEILHGNDTDAPICTGEEFLYGFSGSAGHLNCMFSNNTQVGFGVCRGTVCELYGN